MDVWMTSWDWPSYQGGQTSFDGKKNKNSKRQAKNAEIFLVNIERKHEEEKVKISSKKKKKLTRRLKAIWNHSKNN